ncbi:PUB36 [Symbiodinium sp. CCMP2592]|nr:PUB36 [Symbiodinium sp. CCMP2592]
MPLYAINASRGVRFHGVPPRGAQICRLPARYSHEASDEDEELDWPAQSEASDSSQSVNDFVLNPPDGMSEVDSGSAASPTVSRHSSTYELPRFGLADSDLSETDFLGVGEETDDSHDSESDLSNVHEVDLEDDEEIQEIPNPPQLPSVAEERLQEVWPLGEATFGIFICPITHDVMTDPVVCADGYTYERTAISRWFETSRKSPVTGQSLPHVEMVPNQSVRTLLKTLIDMSDKPQASSSRRGSVESPEKSNEETRAAEKDSKQPKTADLQARLQMISMSSGQMTRDNSGDEKPCLCRRPSSSVDTETDLVRGSSSSSSSSSSSGQQSERRHGGSESRISALTT